MYIVKSTKRRAAGGFMKYAKVPSELPQDNASNHDGGTASLSNGQQEKDNAKVRTKNGGRQRGSSKSKGAALAKTSPPAPDGGYGWFILLAAHCTLIFREGIAKCLGIFLPTFRTYFNVSTSLIGWISSLCVTFADFTGLVSGPLCRTFGCRPIAMIGGFFGGMGLILASATTQVGQLSVCLSISGIGLGLALTPSLTMVGRYFEKRYSLANGLSYAGSGVGILVLAPLAQILIDTYGWRGGLLIMGALCFHVSTCGALLRPIRGAPVTTTRRESKTQYKLVQSDDCVDEKTNGANGTPMTDLAGENGEAPDAVEFNNSDHEQKSGGDIIEMESIQKEKTTQYIENGQCNTDNRENYTDIDLEKEANETESDDDDDEPTTTRRERCATIMGLSLFKDVNFIILMIVQFCGRFTYMGWLIYLVPHAHEKGVEPMQATFIASVAGISNIIARAGHGLIVDYKLLTAAQLLTVASFFSAAPMLLDPITNTYWALIVASLTYGLASGVFFPIAVVVVKQSIGMERFPNALGWSYGFAGIGRMSAGFLTGWLFDHFGSYDESFILLGLIQAFASAMLIILLFLTRKGRTNANTS